MGMFGKFGKSVSNVGNTISRKTKNYAEENQLKNDIKNLEEDIQDWYCDIGELIYKKHKDASMAEPDFTQLFYNIDEAKKSIESKKNTCNRLRGIVLCTNCGNEIAYGVKFCPECGEKQPLVEQEEPEAIVEVSEKTGAEENVEAPEETGAEENVEVSEETMVEETVEMSEADETEVVEATAQTETEEPEEGEKAEEKPPAEAFCPECGHLFVEGTKYCSVCGAPLTFED